MWYKKHRVAPCWWRHAVQHAAAALLRASELRLHGDAARLCSRGLGNSRLTRRQTTTRGAPRNLGLARDVSYPTLHPHAAAALCIEGSYVLVRAAPPWGCGGATAYTLSGASCLGCPLTASVVLNLRRYPLLLLKSFGNSAADGKHESSVVVGVLPRRARHKNGRGRGRATRSLLHVAAHRV